MASFSPEEQSDMVEADGQIRVTGPDGRELVKYDAKDLEGPNHPDA